MSISKFARKKNNIADNYFDFSQRDDWRLGPQVKRKEKLERAQWWATKMTMVPKYIF